MKTCVYLTVSILALSLIRSLAGTPGQPKWVSPLVTGGAVNGSAAISADGQTIYITSEDGKLYAIDPSTGQNKANWPIQLNNVRSYDNELISSPVVAANGTIYVASTDGNLYNVNPNGSQNWSLPLDVGDNFAGGVAVGADGTVYVTYDDVNKLFAINPTGNNGLGAIQWVFDTSQVVSFVDSCPSVGPDGTIYFFGYSNNQGTTVLVAVSCQGVLKWTFPLHFGSEDTDDFQYTPVIDSDGTIYVPYGCSADTLTAVKPDGTPKWHTLFATFTGLPVTSSPAIGSDGTLYFGAGDGTLYAVNNNGTLKWAFDTQTHASIDSSPVVASDGTVYVGGPDGRLWAVGDNTSSGYLKWTFPSLFSQPNLGAPIISSPVLSSDNTLYFGCANDNVYAVYSEVGSLPNSPWPMFRKNPKHLASLATSCCGTTIGVTLDGPQIIHKGFTGFGTTYSGYTWFTISRPYAGPQLQVTFLLGGDGTTQSPIDNTIYALRPQDFTASGANYAPFPNGYYFIMQSGQTQQTVGVQTVDGNHISSEQLLLLTIPEQGCIVPNPNAMQATAYIDDPNFDQ